MSESLEVSMKRVATAVKSGNIKKAEKLFNKVMNIVEHENKEKKNGKNNSKKFTFKHTGGRRHKTRKN